MSETEPRLIANTTEHARHPWPADCYIQGGDRGVVFGRDGQPYRTAFVEAFPDTFLRGEGPTIADAEDACWAKYQRMVNCEHGPFERRGYTNGGGFCVPCGTFFSNIFRPLPPDPDAPKSLMERVFGDLDMQAAAEVLETVARVDDLPLAGEG